MRNPNPPPAEPMRNPNRSSAEPMPSLFGTDGVRGVANRDLTPDLALALGRAAGHVLAPTGGTVIVGRDTRVSGPMLEGALVAGLCSAGTNVSLAGVLPTPAVAYLTAELKAGAGAVISASHNPVADNGIKFFSDEGTKISPGAEEEIEATMEKTFDLPSGTALGGIEILDDASARYVGYLARVLETPLSGLKVVLDCAYGAAWEVGPQAFREAGAEVIALNAEADGSRINVDCGSTAPDGLRARVTAEGADLGIALDGDADRAIAVDERGDLVDGDRILALCALRLKDTGALTGDVVVSTVMANLGFMRALHDRGIDVIAAPVGDRHVATAMMESGAVLGGEQSGHIIFARHAATGDGILTGLKVAEAVAGAGRPLSSLAHVFEPWPQVLINVPVRAREGLETAEQVWEAARKAEEELGDDGRVLLRPSGTEPLVRVLVEAVEERLARETAERLAETVRAALG